MLADSAFHHLSTSPLRWPVRGFPSHYEVLTEQGWFSFAELAAMLPAGSVFIQHPERKLEQYNREPVQAGAWGASEHLPKVVSVLGPQPGSPSRGQVVFSSPTELVAWDDPGYVIQVAARGVRLDMSTEAQLLSMGFYQRSPHFVVADKIRRSGSNRVGRVMRDGATSQDVGRRVHWKFFNRFLYQGRPSLRRRSVDLPATRVPWEDQPVSLLHPYLTEEGIAGIEAGKVFLNLAAPVQVDAKKSISRSWAVEYANPGLVEHLDQVPGGYWLKKQEPDTAAVARTVTFANLRVPEGSCLVVREPNVGPARRPLWRGTPVVVGDSSEKNMLEVRDWKNIR